MALSSFFGDKPKTSNTSYVPQFPKQVEPYIEEILKSQKELFDKRVAEGYQQYPGQTVADFSPEQIAAQEGLISLVGTQAPLQEEALNIRRGLSSQFTPETAQQYMSPYLRTALDAQKAESQRQYERSKRPEFEAQAVRAGGRSGLGTRAAVESAERELGQQRLLANIEAAGQQKAFESAQDAFENQKKREALAASGIAGLSKDILAGGIREQGLLQTVGEQRQAMDQSALDEAYLKYMDRYQYPASTLSAYQSAIYGNPILKQPSYTASGQQGGGGPTLGKTLLQLGAGALSLLPSKSGGGIASTMKAQPYVQYINRDMGGQVMPVMYRQASGLIGDEDETKGLTADEAAIVASKADAAKYLGLNSQQAVDSATQDLVNQDANKVESAVTNQITTLLVENFKFGKESIRQDVSDATIGGNKARQEEIATINKLKTDYRNKITGRLEALEKSFSESINNDPNERKQFWLRIAAEVGKEGDGISNFITGALKATMDSKAAREKKNQLFRNIQKEGMRIRNEIDKQELTQDVKIAGLTSKQKQELAGLPFAIRKAILEEFKITGDFQAAKARASGATKSEMRKLASLDKGVRININKQAAQAFGFTLDNEGDFQGTDKQRKLYERQTKPIIALYNKMMLAYGSTKNRVEGQKLADKVLFDHSRKGSTSSGVIPPPPANTVSVR